jgi:hypothetical protein
LRRIAGAKLSFSLQDELKLLKFVAASVSQS